MELHSLTLAARSLPEFTNKFRKYAVTMAMILTSTGLVNMLITNCCYGVNYFQVVNDLQAYLVLQAVNLHEAIFPEESGDWFAIEISVGSAILMS